MSVDTNIHVWWPSGTILWSRAFALHPCILAVSPYNTRPLDHKLLPSQPTFDHSLSHPLTPSPLILDGLVILVYNSDPIDLFAFIFCMVHGYLQEMPRV